MVYPALSLMLMHDYLSEIERNTMKQTCCHCGSEISRIFVKVLFQKNVCHELGKQNQHLFEALQIRYSQVDPSHPAAGGSDFPPMFGCGGSPL